MSNREHSGETVSQACDTLILLEGLEAFEKYLQLILKGSHRRLHILSNKLDPLLFANEKTCSLISELARRHPQVEIRIMVKSPQLLIGHHHKLVSLQQRLSSKIELRKLLTKPNQESQGYIIVDGRQVLLQHNDGEYEGFCNTDDAPQANALLEEFHHLWETQTEEIKELRTLSL